MDTKRSSWTSEPCGRMLAAMPVGLWISESFQSGVLPPSSKLNPRRVAGPLSADDSPSAIILMLSSVTRTQK